MADFRPYFFEPMRPPTLQRFERYCRNVTKGLRKQLHADLAKRGAAGVKEHGRIRASVHAFALNELGEAYLSADKKGKAVKVLSWASCRNPNYVLPYHNLATLPEGWARRKPIHYLKRVTELRPRWPNGRLALASHYAQAAPDALEEERRAADLCNRIQNMQDKLRVLETEIHVAREHAQKLGLSLGAAGQLEVAPLPSSKSRTDIEEELEALKKQRSGHERKVAEKTELAKEYRKDARELTRSLLPHEWLWKGGEIDPRLLRNPVLKSELRWERKFNDLHVQALYTWTLAFVHDRAETGRALEFLSHCREHYWPAYPTLLGHWLRLKLREAGSNPVRKKSFVTDALGANPTVVSDLPDLDGLGFNPTEQVALLERAIDFDPEDANAWRLRRRLADVYEQIGSTHQDAQGAVRWFRLAAEANRHQAPHHAALASKLEEAADARGRALLEEALAAAMKACELAPSSPSYATQADRLRTKCAGLQHREKMEQEIEERFGADAKKLRAVESPMLVEYSENLENVFRPPAQSEEEKARDTALEDLNQGLFYQLGVRFPPVKFRRATNGAENRYTISLWGIALAAGELRTDRWLFSTPPATLQSQGIKTALEASNPANGNLSSWVESAELGKAQEYAKPHHIYFWRPFEYVVLHLAAVFRNNARDFLRVDDVLRLMSYWGLEEEGAHLHREGLLIEITNALRALVADEFRILYLEATIRAFRQAYAPGESLTEVVERMRRHPDVRKQNPCFRGEYTLIRVGPKFETTIEKGLRPGKAMVLALEPAIAQKLLATVRNYVRDLGDPSPFLLCSPRLRPWIRKLVELEFPFFRVVSEPEVLPEGIRRITRTLEYENI